MELVSSAPASTINKPNSNAQIAARDDNRKLALLVAIERIPKPTEKDLIEATSIPRRCVHSMIKSFNRMSVEIERVNGRRHGYYTIADAGVFNMNRASEILETNYPVVFDQIQALASKKEDATELRATDGGNQSMTAA